MRHTEARCAAVRLYGEALMLICPMCDEPLKTRTSDGWICRCGETIPEGFERDDEENCETCSMKDCPRRR